MTYKVLVTGGLGFVGTHIVDYLLRYGHEVSVIDDLSSNVVSKDYFDSEIELFIGNISDARFTNSIFSREKYDYVFHFAANASVPKSIDNDDLNFSSNVTGTFNILKGAVRASSAVILASSSAVYGEQNGEKVSEESCTKPISPYGVSKLIDEELCFTYGRIYGNMIVAFRFFNIYGPRQRRYVAYDFINKFSDGNKDIMMLGTGREVRDFINIKDAITAIMMPLKNEQMWNEIYNVGSGVGIKIKDLLNIMLDELNESRNLVFSGTSWKGDVSGLYADIDKIRSIGFEPVVSLRSGIREFIESEARAIPVN
jgi:UDP-glucose 4-epimerase